jgi:hypothetical protein
MTIIQTAINDGTLKSYIDFRSGSTYNYANNNVSFTKSGSMVFDKKGIRFASGAFIYSTDSSHQFNATGSYTWFFVASPRTIEGGGDSLALCGSWGINGWGIYVSNLTYPRRIKLVDFLSSGSAGYQTTDLINQNVEFCGVVTYNNGSVKIYINGVDNSATVFGTPNWQSTTSAQFKYSNSTVDYFSGLYSVGGYMTKALTALEVAQLTSELNTNVAFNTKTITRGGNVGIVPLTESNLIGYWKMKPLDRRIEDLSGNNYTASYNGYMTHSKSQIGDALRFSGSNALLLPNTAAISSSLATTGFTVMAVVKSDTLAASQYIWAYSGAFPTANFNWYLAAGTGKPALIIGDGATQEYLTATGTALVTGKWQLVAVTYNPSTKTATFYNGVLSENVVGALTLQGNTKSPYIGAYAGSSLGVNGQIAEVALFNTPLDSTTINRIHTNFTKITEGKTEFGAYESDGNVSSAFIENTNWNVASGNWQIVNETINNKPSKVLYSAAGARCSLDKKYLWNTVSEFAFGSWEWSFKHASNISMSYYFYTSNTSTTPSYTGYRIFYDGTSGKFALYKSNGTVETLVSRTIDYSATINNLWSKFRVVRQPNGAFYLYLNDTLMTADGGYTNPVIDTTYTIIGNYFHLSTGGVSYFSLGDATGSNGFSKKVGGV